MRQALEVIQNKVKEKEIKKEDTLEKQQDLTAAIQENNNTTPQPQYAAPLKKQQQHQHSQALVTREADHDKSWNNSTKLDDEVSVYSDNVKKGAKFLKAEQVRVT